jgi:hypothetical protein
MAQDQERLATTRFSLVACDTFRWTPAVTRNSNAATLHCMEPQHPERLTNPGRVNVFPRPSSYFTTSTLSRLNLLTALEFALKRLTYQSTCRFLFLIIIPKLDPVSTVT